MTTHEPLSPAPAPKLPRGVANFFKIKKEYGMYSGAECNNIARLLPNPQHLVESLIPPGSVNLLVGDSGIGKSPLAYQLALSIASGLPFLGLPTRPGKVIFADYENNLSDIDWILRRQSKYLALDGIPNNFLLWPLSRDPFQKGVGDMVYAFQPDIVIIDSLRAAKPDMETNSRSAVQAIREMRLIAAERGTAFLLVHHLRKRETAKAGPDVRNDARNDARNMESIESGHALDWLRRASGVRAIINQTDVRLALARRDTLTNDLIMSGHFRTRGNVGPYLIRRVCDGEGEPLGYERYIPESIPELITKSIGNVEHEAAFARLPHEFTFKQARFALGKGPEVTNRFLRKLQGVGLLEKAARGVYRKTCDQAANAAVTASAS